MALIDIFKKKKVKKEDKKVQKKKPKLKSTKEAKPVVEKVRPVEKPKEEVKAIPKKKTDINEAYRVLKSPHITEKATDLTKKNQYIFKVYSGVNKVEIKKAIEDVYGVNVLDVKIINVSPKRRRLGRISGWRKGYKKAIIKIKEGQKIEVLPR